jgi:hypothetical protein
MEGWIKLERGVLNHWVFDDPIKFRIWVGLLLVANHSDQKVNIGLNIYDCKRGQSIRSLLSWAKTFKVSKDYVRNFFKLLEKDGMITIENIQISTRITICNYDSYQDVSNDKPTTAKRKPNANQTLAHPNKNDKNDNNENNEKNLLAERQLNFRNEVFSFSNVYHETMLQKFYDYWSEKTVKEFKMKQEIQKTWETSKRLSTWSKNNFDKGQTTKIETKRPMVY